MTPDEFAGAADQLIDRSDDLGVHAVSAMADTLCDDLLPFFPLRERLRVPPKVRRQMAIAALFLYSDTEYEWASEPNYPSRWPDHLLMLACVACVIAAMFLVPLGCALGIARRPVVSGMLLLAAGVCIVAAMRVYQYSHRLAARRHAAWEHRQRQIGDYDVWPFRRRADFDEARRHPRLLCG
jgi:hypothetical protein